MPVSNTWRGHGSAIFLELGKIRLDPGGGHPHGQASFMIEWSWRVEGPRSIQLGSWSTERRITSGVARLKGLRVREVSVVGRLPELSVGLSGGRWVHSFMTERGLPAWTIFLPDGSWICVERGTVIHNRQNVGRH